MMIIDFHWPQIYTSSSFIVSNCNSNVFKLVKKVDKWPTQNLVIYGPHFSGKTHLGRIFLEQNGGQLLNSNDLSVNINSSCVVDGLENFSEENIMSIFFRTQPFKIPVLWLSLKPTIFSINDLNTRFNSILSLHISEPDEDTFKLIFTKRCADFGLAINEEILEYIVRRSKITYYSINELVLKLNSYCLEHIRAPSIPILSKLLGDSSENFFEQDYPDFYSYKTEDYEGF